MADKSEKKKTSTLTVREVKAILDAERANSLSSDGSSKLAEDRTTAMKYYLGDMDDMKPAEGRSKVISTDVSDVIGGLMPGLMEIFCGSDEVCRFDPVGPEDIPAAEQETVYINHVFRQRNPGYAILHAMFKDGLLQKTGTVKVWWEENESEEDETYYGQDIDSIMILLQKPDMEVTAHTANDDGTHDITLTRKAKYGCAKVMNVPPEEFGVSRRTRRLQDTPFCFHEPGGGRPEAELIAEGYDEEQIKSLATWSEATTAKGQEARARDTVDENSQSEGTDSLTRGMRPVRITENYLVFDYEGKGKACRYKIMTGGDKGEVLIKNDKPAIEKHDYVPFAVVHPDPMPHRYIGRCPADNTIETQRVKTVLTRGVLDNMYLINNQQLEVNEQFSSDSTLDDLLRRTIGGVVRTKAKGAVNPIVVQPIADKLFPALEYFDREREWRTGVTREGQGLDAEALQNQSATAARQVHTASQAKMKLIARNFADGVEDLFWLIHCVVRRHASKPDTVKIRGNWVPIDPRTWRERNHMTVTVGLGSGGKQEQLANLQVLIQAQAAAAENPMLKLVKPKNLYNSAKDLVKLLDKHDVELYFSDPGDGDMPEPPPPPEIQKAQIEGQIKQQEMQQKAGIEKLQAEADIATNNTKIGAEIQRDDRKMALEMEMKRQEHALKMEEMRMKLISTAVAASTKAVPQVGENGEQQPAPKPDMGVFDQIMARVSMVGAGPAPGGGGAAPSRKRMSKQPDGSWMVETVQ